MLEMIVRDKSSGIQEDRAGAWCFLGYNYLSFLRIILV